MEQHKRAAGISRLSSKRREASFRILLAPTPISQFKTAKSKREKKDVWIMTLARAHILQGNTTP